MQQIMNNLYIGDIQDALNTCSKQEKIIIVSLVQDIPLKLCFNSIPSIIHIPLFDGKNELIKIKTALQVICTLLEKNNKVLIACRAGLSRSVIITTAVYALQNKISFDEAYNYINKVYPQNFPEQELFQQTKKVTEELMCSS